MTAPLDVVTYVHERHEDLARFRGPLERAGFRPVERLRSPDLAADARAPLLVVLGGPMGVYDADRFPFLRAELEVLRARLAADRPSIGLCLGSQLLAAAAGSAVFRGARGMSIGVGPITRDGAPDEPLLRDLPDSFDAVHWHGDTFEPTPRTLAVPGRDIPGPGVPRGPLGGDPVPRRAGPGGVPRLGRGLARRPPAHRAGPGRSARRRPPRLTAALPVLDRLLVALARKARAALAP